MFATEKIVANFGFIFATETLMTKLISIVEGIETSITI